jgi:FkbH-like protein
LTAKPKELKVNRTETAQTIAIAATFTAEPIDEFLNFWMRELGLSFNVSFAPYNQVFQQLLNPESLLSQNKQGINLVFLRFEDWQYERQSGSGATIPIDPQSIEHTLKDFLLALKSAAQRTDMPNLVSVCPSSPTLMADPQWVAFSRDLEALVIAELSGIANVYLTTSAEMLAAYPVATYYDAAADRLGHVPYTPLFFSAMSAAIARKIYALKVPPAKVLVLDCDNTLWKGVCGEDGAAGIEISPPFQALQEFAIAQHHAGMLICLNSKNNESDIEEVFRQRLDMPLQRHHILSWRINWEPKSQNLRTLAQELQLGLDSFIFLDDNPVECAEVQANCPEVLTFQVPETIESIPTFLNNIWAFDRLKITAEDRQRTDLYKRNLEREQLRQIAPTLQDFLTELKLEIKISSLSPETVARASQLTQRTNQFNVTTVRRSAGEIQELYRSGRLKCLVVEVKDRFGDYGLVGLMIFDIAANAVNVDTFLLSCRVLGRGVEYQMLSHLAEIAQEQGISQVNIPFLPTGKNQPALNFLQRVGETFKQSQPEGCLFCFSTDFALNLTYAPVGDGIESTGEEVKSSPEGTDASLKGANIVTESSSKSNLLQCIANELDIAEHVLRKVEQQSRQHSDLVPSQIEPQTDLEQKLSELWAKLLRLDNVSIRANFFDLGGTSLQAVQLFSQIEQIFDKSLPLTTLLEAPTVAQLAGVLQRSAAVEEAWTPLIPIQTGGTQPPLFCPQGAGGNVIVYRKLAQLLGEDRPVYGLQARGLDGKEDPYTWIEEMAEDYLRHMRSVQPQGPYFLAGLSSGGRVAFEIAQQLRAQGESVGLVAMFDTYAPGFPKLLPPLPRLLSLLKFTSLRFLKLTPIEKYQLIRKKLKGKFSQPMAMNLSKSSTTASSPQSRKSLHSVELEPQDRGRAIERWMNRISLILMQSSPWSFLLDWHIPGATEPLPEVLQKIQAANILATLAYKPKIYNGSVTLFCCQPQPAGYNTDPYLGWTELVTGELQVCEVEAFHHDMLDKDASVEAIAEQLKACLKQAQPSV